MKRKKKHEEHVDEAWLLPYSDMLTLLLCFIHCHVCYGESR